MTDPLVDGTRVGELVSVLTEHGKTVATAESLTAGMLAATIAGVAGASAVLRGGLVVYATDLKSTLGGVDRARLAEDGPVAASTARALAEGARERCGADWGVGLTGVAGPDAQGGQQVGTVFVGLAGASGTSVKELRLDGDRWTIRKSAVSVAVSELLGRVKETSGG
ncbi:nicotinamide-nucleotide amidohydrolase family protein [Rhodococcus sp. NPDC049939]|uniref:CinA family protein n=1 Tax=Rhodococcus sp. NPDC049939 TaxID=3155511 RepID=UPI003403449C